MIGWQPGIDRHNFQLNLFIMKEYKKYEISYFFACVFGMAFLVTFRYFDKEAASFFIVIGIVAFIAGVINFKLNR